MNPVPLGALRLRPRDLLSTLWWLALLYRRPGVFQRDLVRLGRGQQLVAAVGMYLHGLPYIVVIAVLGRLLVFGAFGIALKHPLADLDVSSVVSFHVVQMARGIAVGIAAGIALRITVGIPGGIAGRIAGGIPGGIAVAIWFGSAGGITLGIAAGIALGIAAGIASIRAYYLVVHPFFLWPRLRGDRYALHPVAWDDLCGIPFPGLCRLLADYARFDRLAAEAEIERLIDTYPTQRHEALKARTLLIAEDSRSVPLSRLDLALQSLPEGQKGFLREVPALKSQVAAIAQAQRRLDAVNVPAFREPIAAALVREIRDFHARVAGLRYPLNTAFRQAALAWLTVAERQHSEAKRILETRPVAQVFRAGDPVERSQEAFLPRWPIIEELQGQITLATGCPRLLLYGRRRMGKSTLLKNLPPFLPSSIAVASLSMQDPRVLRIARSVGGLGCRLHGGGGRHGGAGAWRSERFVQLARDARCRTSLRRSPRAPGGRRVREPRPEARRRGVPA